MPELSSSQMIRVSPGIPQGLWHPGSEGNDWMGAQQADRRSHGGRAP